VGTLYNIIIRYNIKENIIINYKGMTAAVCAAKDEEEPL